MKPIKFIDPPKVREDLNDLNEWANREVARICGIPLKADASLPPDVVEFRHPDGRVDRFKV